jgi:hypothetical protein
MLWFGTDVDMIGIDIDRFVVCLMLRLALMSHGDVSQSCDKWHGCQSSYIAVEP